MLSRTSLRAAARLHFRFQTADEVSPTVDAIDATLHAALIGQVNSNALYMAFVRVSTVHRLAKEAYYQKKFRDAESYALRALEMEPERWPVLVVLIKALIQQDKNESAEKHLPRLVGDWLKMQHYLRGFMAKKRHDFTRAVTHFEAAIRVGDDSISVHRDLADSLYRAGNLREAVVRIEKARTKGRDNAFVLDLALRIYLDANEAAKAAECLSDLEKCDVQERFIHHCKARLLADRGDYELALKEAELACMMTSPPFEVIAKKIDILMQLRRHPEAWNELEELAHQFPSHRKDVMNGLRCKWYATQGNWRKAKVFWDDIREKDAPVNQGLLRVILEVKGKDTSLSLVDRNKAIQEAQAITAGRFDVAVDDGEVGEDGSDAPVAP